MNVHDLKIWLAEHKEALIASLLDGSYQPQPVRGVEIPKPGGGVRQLGIPTVEDRLVQQAILQVLEPLLDPAFSESSYGFRPGRSAHQALHKGKEYVADVGRPWSVAAAVPSDECRRQSYRNAWHGGVMLTRLPGGCASPVGQRESCPVRPFCDRTLRVQSVIEHVTQLHEERKTWARELPVQLSR